MKKRKAKPATVGAGLWIKIVGLAGAFGVFALVATFAILPFARPTPSSPPKHRTLLLGGQLYEMTILMQPDGGFAVELLPPAGFRGVPEAPSAELNMRGGIMHVEPPVIQQKPGNYAIRGTLPMRGDWDLALTAAGRKVIVALPNNWSF